MSLSRLGRLALIAALLSVPVLPAGEAALGAGVAQAQGRLEALINRLRRNSLPEGIVKANGRIEAEQVDIAAKYPGRLVEVLVEEGSMVEAGQVVARMDDSEYRAQLRGAEAQVQRAIKAKAEAEALIAQRESDRTLARAELARAEELFAKGHFSQERLDQRRSQMKAADAALRAAQAARDQAIAAIEAAQADVARLETVLSDTVLKAPRRGRVQYKLVRSGEVVAAGQRIVTLLDLTDVYMTIFLPARDAGRVILGDEARIILDPVPQYVVPARVSFVAAEAQFTPKAVETADEREKLMFRVKIRIDPNLLKQYEPQVKTGVRGIGFVRTVKDADWPTDLAIRLPD
ncbi:HlyD family secretion protein [Chelatococcus composti]|jgi:HlyD family secretion protein|uniref:HlyD family secretion protein n=1 Tax=Chelatococcus composti TaxID=1743235 RepID=A0A841KJ13_9HYPH|nr:HlyD family efflux transporter periplasmic adaptor subunit [Chelatococcus composti]MBB6169383.1 HlyD family secretion protein [Chelatococcus composti]MBS7736950.1 HlyD family efflux transporter periplasmic adaptor subunit [Chelatococcus composti]GGG47369.1 hemolysin secretion protein D [Chelatococcus composti]